MEQRGLGASGPRVSVVGLGCNNLGMRIDERESAVVVRAAIDAGITHFDTAEMYGGGYSEEFLGKALGRDRDDVTIATKFLPRPADEPYVPGGLATRIVRSCEGSLKRLGTDRIDVYYQHYLDAEAPLDEVIEAMDGLVRAGKVLHLACSNYTAETIAEAREVAQSRGSAGYVATQLEWNLLNRAAEEEVVPAAVADGLGIVPYFPLASGMLTGKYPRGEPYPEGTRFHKMGGFASIATDENHDKVDALRELAEALGRTVGQLAIAWLAAQPGVATVIAGATRPEQVTANVAGGEWKLAADDLEEIAERV